MIRRVSSSLPSFRTVDLKPGFNVILAERTKESTRKDTVNGLGKSTLIDIIHFCLGAQLKAGTTLAAGELVGQTFTLDLELGGKSFSIARATDQPRTVTIVGDTSSWAIKPKKTEEGRAQEMSDRDLWDLLGNEMFGLPVAGENLHYKPTFRSLISYIIRRGEAYSTPFEHNRKQQGWDSQVNSAFLLGLHWEDASRMQSLRDKEAQLREIKKASSSGVLENVLGTRGDLEATKVRLENAVRDRELALKNFRVIKEYESLQNQADQLTTEIHDKVNANVADRELLSFYEGSLRDEQGPPVATIRRLYDEAEVVLPPIVLARLDDVARFHERILAQRKEFLQLEIDQIKVVIADRELEIRRLDASRESILKTLSTGHALDEYMLLQQQYLGDAAMLKDVSSRLDNVTSVEKNLASVRVEKEQAVQRALTNYTTLESNRKRAIDLFGKNSQALYHAPGNLVIDIDRSGFRFSVLIQGRGSTGIESMNVFCYDLTVAQLWARRKSSPRFLLHDSSVFDPVDSRQVANALEWAEAESRRLGFQYVVTMNADRVPRSDFTKGFDFDSFVRLTLTDSTPEGCLLGFRIKHAPTRDEINNGERAR